MENNLQQIADNLKNFPGNVKGEALITRKDFIMKKEGEEGIKKLEEKMEELGAPVRFNEITSSQWISEGLNSLSVVVAKEIFGWSEEDVFELGRFELKNSFVTRTMLTYFVSLKKGFSIASKYWRRYYDFGELVAKELNEEEKYMIIQKKGFKTHPILCMQHAGYLAAGVELLIRTEKVTVEEVKCIHKGDPYHEYKISWEK